MAQSRKQVIARLDTFTKAYITCALWSSNDESTPEGGEPIDKNYSIDDIEVQTLLAMEHDCKRFQKENEESLVDYPSENAGHDFWLTRNGHGAGFWENDFGTETKNKNLTESCKTFGQCDLSIHNGKVHAHQVIYCKVIDSRYTGKQVLQRSESGYGRKLNTDLEVKIEGESIWRKVYMIQYSNAGSPYVLVKGRMLFIHEYEIKSRGE